MDKGHAKIAELLEREIAIVGELLALTEAFSSLGYEEGDKIEALIARRQKLIESLQNAEAEASKLSGLHGLNETLKRSAASLLSLSGDLQRAEARVGAHLENLLVSMRNNASAIDRGRVVLQSYAIPPSHLSRFTDKTG